MMMYMYIVIPVLLFVLALFSFEKCFDENDVFNSRTKVYEETKQLSDLIVRNMNFLNEHAGYLEIKNNNELKMELIRISEEACINDISISDVPVDKNKTLGFTFYKFIVAVKAIDEKSIYKFLLLLEHVLSGVVSIDNFEMASDNSAKVAITVGSFNCIRNKVASNKKRDMAIDYNQCEFSLFNTALGKSYKLCGIINNTAFIKIIDDKNNCKHIEFIIGDNLGIYTIIEINNSNIVVEEKSGLIKIIDLGMEF